MATNSIGPRIVLEGEKEYRKAIQDINKEMRVLTSEMKATSAQFDGNANSMEALRAKSNILGKEYETQFKLIGTINGALENAKTVYGENSNQVKDWQIKLNNANAELSRISKEIQDNNKHMDEAKKSTDGTAKSIDEFGNKIEDADKKTEKANKTFAAVAAGVAAMTVALKKAAESAFDLAKGAASYADDILTLSAQTGIATDTLQELKYMEELVDVSLETVTSSMAKQIRSMKQAQDGTKSAIEAYKKLGVEYQNIDGSLRDSETVFWEVIDALGAMQNETERDATAMQLLGRSAQDLNPLIKIGSRGVAEFAEEARRVGAVLDQDTLGKLGETDDAIQRMNQTVEIAKRKIGMELAPVTTEAMQKIVSKLSDADSAFTQVAKGGLELAVDTLGWIVDNADLVIGGITGIVAGMAAFKVGSAIQTGLTAAIESWKAYKTATEGATVVQWALNAAMNANPVGIIAAALGLATGTLTMYALNAKSATSETTELKTATSELADKIRNLSEEIQESSKNYEANIMRAEEEAKTAKNLADRLYELAEKTQKSNKERAEMVSIINGLNRIMPELNLNLDTETGILNKQKNEVYNLIDAHTKLAKAKAAQERLVDIQKQQIDNELLLKKLEEEREQLIQKYGKSMDKLFNKILDNPNLLNRLRYFFANLVGGDAFEEIGKIKIGIEQANEQSAKLKEEYESLMQYIADKDLQIQSIYEIGDAAEKTAGKIAISETELTAEMDRLYKERQKKEEATLEYRRNKINEHYEKLYEDLEDRIWEERRALEKAQKAQLDSLKAANDRELQALEEQHNKKLALIDEEYTERSKLVDEQRYMALKAIQDEIDALENKTKQEEAEEKQRQNEEKKAELLTKIEKAKSLKQRHEAEQELAEFEKELARERELAERELQIEKLEAQKETINQSFDAQVTALKDEQKQKEEAAKKEYEAEKTRLKDILDLKVEELQEKQELEDKAYQKKWDQMKKNLQAEKEAALKNMKEIYDTNLEMFKNSEKLKQDAMKKLAEETAKLQKENGKSAAEGFIQGFIKGFKGIEGIATAGVKGAVAAVQVALDIHSPSKVFMQLGEFTAEGFGEGFKRRMARINNELSAVLPTSINNVTGGSLNSVSTGRVVNAGGVTLNIDKFYNNRDIDLEGLIAELEFIKNKQLMAGGVK